MSETHSAKELLHKLAVQANNIIMKGHFTGDDIHEASDVMKLCIRIVEIINDEQQKSDG